MTTHHLALRPRMSGAITLFPSYASMEWEGITSPFYFTTILNNGASVILLIVGNKFHISRYQKLMFPTKSQPCLCSLVLSNGMYKRKVTKQQLLTMDQTGNAPYYLYRLHIRFQFNAFHLRTFTGIKCKVIPVSNSASGKVYEEVEDELHIPNFRTI
jgi:hypothetical protein